MREVVLDDDVFGAIQAQAEPLVDDVNSVLRRLFGLDGGAGAPPRNTPPRTTPPRAGRAAPGSILAESEYEVPILTELLARGGGGQAAEITDAVGERLADRLTELDRKRHDSGEIRWRNRAAFTRLTLRRRGLLKADSPRGIWELTEAGRKAAESAQKGR